MSGGPENFVNFADYLGLNDEAGQEMLRRTLQEGAGENNPDNIRELAGKHYASAETDGDAFGKTGEVARKGLASYSDFMRGMNDPVERQALLQKTFGGQASRFDAMLAGHSGGGAGLRQANENLRGLESDVSRSMSRADSQKAGYEQATRNQRAQEEAERKRKQMEAAERERQELGMQWALASWDRLNPNNSADAQLLGMTPAQRRQAILQSADQRGLRDRGGSINWEGLSQKWQEEEDSYLKRIGNNGPFGLNVGKNPGARYTGNSWSDYYQKNKKLGGA